MDLSPTEKDAVIIERMAIAIFGGTKDEFYERAYQDLYRCEAIRALAAARS